jgi:hypothetical protein
MDDFSFSLYYDAYTPYRYSIGKKKIAFVKREGRLDYALILASGVLV